MLIQFHRPDTEQEVVGTATWDGRQVHIEAESDETRAALARIFRPTPVVVHDRAYRRLGPPGEAMFQPGSLEWFRTVALSRAKEAGLVARFVPAVTQSGWDPAAAYRTFAQVVDRLGSES